MFCSKCGKQIDDDAKFCEYCGEQVKEEFVSKVTESGNNKENVKVNDEVSNNQNKIAAEKESKKLTALDIIIGLIGIIAPIAILIVVIILIVNFIIGFKFSIEMVREGSPTFYTQYSDKELAESFSETFADVEIGEVLEYCFDDTKWEYKENVNDGVGGKWDIVQFTGTYIDTSGTVQKVSINFRKYIWEEYLFQKATRRQFCVESIIDTGRKYSLGDVYYEFNDEEIYYYLKDCLDSFSNKEKSSNTNTIKPMEKITTHNETKPAATTAAATTTAATTKEKSDNKTYSITFEADELIEEAGLQLGGHVGVAVLSNLTCSNGNANIETETIYAYDSLVRVEVTGAKAGEVVLGGTITTYGLDMFEGETVSYPVDSGVFLISKTVGEISDDKPYVNADIEASRLTRGDGYEYNLYVDGDFSYVEVSYCTNEAGGGSNSYTSGSSSPIFLTSGSSFTSVTAYVTPYSADGIAGETVSCTGYASGTIQSGGTSYPVDNMKGQINCHGGTVAGFTTDYVVNGGIVGKVRNSLGDTWHVTAKNACDNYGVTWYELWDSDDGDYYGWVDSSYIDFY